MKAQAPWPEITFRSAVITVLATVVMLTANLYLSLMAGLSISGSIPSAIFGMAMLAAWQRMRHNNSSLIGQGNIVQTGGSTGETISAQLGFAVVALYLAGIWQGFGFWQTAALVLGGGLSGVLFNIPLRRVFIVDKPSELNFPEGKACAEVLQSGDRPGTLGHIIKGGICGGLVTLLVKVEAIAETVAGAVMKLPMAFNASPALMGVGFILGIETALPVFIGTAIVWFGMAPMLGVNYANPEVFGQAIGWWKGPGRLPGVGAMLVAGLFTVVFLMPRVKAALVTVAKGRRTAGEVASSEQDLTGWAFWAPAVVAFAIVYVMSVSVMGGLLSGLFAAIVVMAFGFVIAAVAAYTCGLLGSTSSPVSGMTILALFVAAGVAYLGGLRGNDAIAATLVFGSIVCGIACTAGNIAQDFATGYILKATPWRQQVVSFGAVLLSAPLAGPLLTFFQNTSGIGDDGKLGAPKAALINLIVNGLFGDGQINWSLVGVGAVIGLIICVIDLVLKRRQQEGRGNFRLPAMAVAVGMYLPIFIPAAILLGALIKAFVFRGRKMGEAEAMRNPGSLLACGLIAGEILMALAVDFPKLWGSDIKFSLGLPGMTTSGLLTIGVLLLLAQVARRGLQTEPPKGEASK